MFIIQENANPNGSRPPLQSWNSAKLPEGYAWIADEFKDIFYSTTPAGFVNITIEQSEIGKIVTNISVNQEGLDAYMATLPNPVIAAKEEKIKEIKKSCEDKILNGTEVQYADGTKEHFTYSLADQSNISEMFTAAMAGASEFPYHSDGNVCKVYTKEQIVQIYGTLSLFKTEATTYHNSLKAQVNAMEAVEEVDAVEFGKTKLTGEYLNNYNVMMASATTQLNAVLARIPSDVKL